MPPSSYTKKKKYYNNYPKKKPQLSVKQKTTKTTSNASKKRTMLRSITNKMESTTTRNLKNVSFQEKITKGRKKIMRLVNHKRNDQIKLVTVGYKKAFTINFGNNKDYLYPGLTKRLHQTFYPELEEDPTKKRKDTPEGERTKVQSPFYQPSKLPRTCKLFGKDHGTQVHGELEKFTNYIINGQGKDKFFSDVSDPDPCTLRVLSYLESKKWIPILSEHKIWDEDLRLATSVDMIALDMRTGKVIMIELKTGYEGEIYGPTENDPKFPAPLETITNCPLNRHMLQLLSMDLILKKKYGISLDELCIIRSLSKQKSVQKISPPGWTRTKVYRENVYEMLALAASK